MISEWHIREATAADAGGLEACMQAAYGAYQARMGQIRLPPLDVDYLAEIINYPSWVVESNGRILGGLIMSFDNARASIANIAVDPECQGQGIGGALVKFAQATARERGFAELFLATHALLHENLSLYRHLGWVETGRAEDRVFMKKKI